MKALSAFPLARLRRLRQSAPLRRMLAETSLAPHQLILPLFTRSGRGVRRPILSMPGVCQLSPDQVLKESVDAHEAGIPAVLLFGIPESKDEKASGAYAKKGIVQQTVRLLKKEVPELLVITDVCLCEYMSHGHCGIVTREAPGGGAPVVLNDATLELLGKTALSHAEAGADLVAPSDMMDGRVRFLRRKLDESGFENTIILAYAAKFASAFYGPFREAAESAPQFGDRRTYQMDPANAAEAMREVALDLEEGADLVLVKPALTCLDIVHRVKTVFGYPTVAYAVSGEFSMIKAAAQRGWLDEKAALLESHLAIRRAGADLIVSYAAPQLARWLQNA